MLNLFLVRHMPTLDLNNRMGGLALGLMNFGNIVLPLTLIAAAAYHPFKYVLPIPATSISLALALAAYGAWSQFRSSRQNRQNSTWS
jgi:4-hydroxybenzoate polyprenyltransferase